MAFCTSVNTIPVTGCLACYRSLVCCEMRSCKATGITGGQRKIKICSHEKPAVLGGAHAWGEGKERKLVFQNHSSELCTAPGLQGRMSFKGCPLVNRDPNQQCPWLPLLWALCRHTWAVRSGNSHPKLSFPKQFSAFTSCISSALQLKDMETKGAKWTAKEPLKLTPVVSYTVSIGLIECFTAFGAQVIPAKLYCSPFTAGKEKLRWWPQFREQICAFQWFPT